MFNELECCFLVENKYYLIRNPKEVRFTRATDVDCVEWGHLDSSWETAIKATPLVLFLGIVHNQDGRWFKFLVGDQIGYWNDTYIDAEYYGP